MNIEIAHDRWCLAVYHTLIATLVASISIYERNLLSIDMSYILDSASIGLNWCTININIAAESIVRVLKNEAAKAIEELRKRKGTIIFRTGSGSYKNLTPRVIDTKGLSYQLTIPLNCKFAFTAMELVNESRVLCAKKDGSDHVSVIPRVMFTLQQWIDTRDTSETKPHAYTILLRSISIRVGG